MAHIYLADPQIAAQQTEEIHIALPPGWQMDDVGTDADAILTENVHVTTEMLAAAGPRLRLILRIDTGKAAIAPTDLPIVDLPNSALLGVAEWAATMILVLGRHLFEVARKTAHQEWAPGRDVPVFTDQKHYTYNWVGLEDFYSIYRKTTGIVGLGYVGKAVAARLRPFGMRLLYTDFHRLPAEDEARYGVEWREMDDLFRESDFVTLHVRFQDGPGGNDKQFGAHHFALMKRTAYFINSARGRVVDEEALVAALQSGQIAGAALDVFRHEPLPANDPLLALAGDSVILTPHIAGPTLGDAWRTIAEELVEKVQSQLSTR